MEKKTSLKLLTGATAINTAINSIQNRSKKLAQDIHVCAVSCLMHADQHGDITLAARLVQALPDMTRKNALLDWLQAFGKFGWDADAKALTFDKTKKTNKEGACETPFWVFKPETEYKPFDLKAELARLVAKATKAAEKGDARDSIPPHMLAVLKQAAATAEAQAPANTDEKAQEAA